VKFLPKSNYNFAPKNKLAPPSTNFSTLFVRHDVVVLALNSLRRQKVYKAKGKSLRPYGISLKSYRSIKPIKILMKRRKLKVEG